MRDNINETEQSEWLVDTSIDQESQLINALDNGNSDVKCLSELESLIRELVSTDCQISQEKAKSSFYHFFPKYIDVVTRLPLEYDYSEYINVFIACCDEFRLFDLSIDVIEQIPKRVIFDLISLISRDCRTIDFREKLRIQRREAGKRYEEYASYIDALFKNNDRLIVIRLDLGYEKHFTKSITLDMALEDIGRLMLNRHNNQMFDHMVGYIIKTEFGIDRRIHFHTLFFFNGSHRQGSAHVRLAQQIGEYWGKTITRDTGIYWNCNNQIDQFERIGRCGIGDIRWNDEGARNNLKNYVLAYLFKLEQGFRPLQHPKAKLIRRGAWPKERVIKLGRPRIRIEKRIV